MTNRWLYPKDETHVALGRHQADYHNPESPEVLFYAHPDGRSHDFFFREIIEDTPGVLRAFDYRMGVVTLRVLHHRNEDLWAPRPGR